MSATSGTGESASISGRALAEASSGTDTLTREAPADARARICPRVALTSVVGVLVMDCTDDRSPSAQEKPACGYLH